ncbi:MAG: redoxin domain-containing protein [Candidatus Dormibacteraeota bacterium]|nr:redoxin domain-containing protein [Candidatus Dormibacteraeota bacterium]
MELQKQLPQIEALHATVVAASVDPVDQSRSLVTQLKLGYPILEDRNHRLGSAFGVFRLPGGMDMGDVDNHSIFVIDPTGHVSWKELAPDTMHVPVADVLAALQKP